MTAIDDDIFARPPRSALRREQPTGRITCRVCDRPATVPLNHPALLCLECMGDLAATEARVRGWLNSLLALMDATIATWEVVRAAHLDKWRRIEDGLAMLAQGQVTEAQFNERWKARYYGADPAWREVMKAYEEKEVACAGYGVERDRLELALREIEAAL
jgi:hypothetical protein